MNFKKYIYEGENHLHVPPIVWPTCSSCSVSPLGWISDSYYTPWSIKRPLSNILSLGIIKDYFHTHIYASTRTHINIFICVYIINIFAW